MEERTYIAIDLKSFYASVECVERGLDPLTANLVVADVSRTEKTICLAVSPSLKEYGIPGRARLFEVEEKVRAVNAERLAKIPGRVFSGRSFHGVELMEDPSLELEYIVAAPRMAHYMDYSTRIYKIYLKYIAPEDIHVYSIDEVFMDVTAYLNAWNMTPKELAVRIIRDVYDTTGITATAGIGTNLYLCKIAMDIVAKHAGQDVNGVRIAQLDEMSYRRLLWNHRPLTDFWRIGRGYARKLEANGLYTMGDIARCSLGGPNDYYNEDLLYRLFGVNAELLIDHAWGWEPCTIADVKAYRPRNSSICSGQVLQCPYPADKARLVVQEMTDLMVYDLVEKRMVTDQIVLDIGYDIENLSDPARRARYRGEVTVDHYGRKVPKHAHGTGNIGEKTSSTKRIMETVLDLYDRIINRDLLVRRVTVTAARIVPEDSVQEESFEQMDLFTDYGLVEKKKKEEQMALEKERKTQQMVLDIKKKFGKNAVLRGMSLQEGATARERNKQIGGHKA